MSSSGRRLVDFQSSCHRITDLARCRIDLRVAFYFPTAMNLSSASHVSRCGKPSRSWSNSVDKVPLQIARNRGYKNPSSEFKSEDMKSVYSDAGETLASRPSNAASRPSNAASRPSNAANEDHHDAVTASLYSNTQDCARDSDSRDFILKRFLPAAQAMAATGVKSSTSTSSQPSENRLQKSSSDISSARLGSSASSSSKSKRQFTHEVKQDVRGDEFNDESEGIKACGFPLHLRRLTHQHFRYSFWTSRSSSRSKSQQSITTASQKVIQEEPSDDSDNLFWSDEERSEPRSNAVSHAAMSGAVRLNERGKGYVSSQVKKRLEAEMLVRPTRLHSMENVHTPDLRGFLGFPKPTKFTKGEMERTRQVDRLGARLTRMISKTNYMESRNGTRIIEHDEIEAGTSSQGPSTTSTSSSSIEAPGTQWVDAVASLMPPPSPKMPSESWLSNTLPPERFMEMKKLPRKSLGSFIPIKLPRKRMPSERHQANPEEVSIYLQQSCSLKEHLRGRQVLRSSSLRDA